MKKQNSIDSALLFTVICFFVISLLAVYSGSGQYETQDMFYFVKRQVFWYIVGFGLMAAVAYFDYELLERLSFRLFAGGLFLIILVHFFGTNQNGSQRWISLGPMKVQPSEFMKIFVILLLAAILNRYKHQRFSFKESMIPTMNIICWTPVPFFLILIQPDLGTALVILSIAFTLMLVSGISSKMIAALIASFLALLAFLTYLHNEHFEHFTKVIKPHQLDRIYGWLSPDEFDSTYGYQLKQAMLGIGSGQLSGSGYTKGNQVQGGNIPEAHTDFIMAIISEELGMMGLLFVMGAYLLIMYRAVRIVQGLQDPFGKLLTIGLTFQIMIQAAFNLGAVFGLLPITGIPLPFISYGGSSLVFMMISAGILVNLSSSIKRHRHVPK